MSNCGACDSQMYCPEHRPAPGYRKSQYVSNFDIMPLIVENRRLRKALEDIFDCPNSNSVEDCHDRMSDIAREALKESRVID